MQNLNEACDAVEPLHAHRYALLANYLFHSRLLLRTLIETSSHDQLLLHLAYYSDNSTSEGSETTSTSIQLSFPLLRAVCRYLVAFAGKIDALNLYVYREVLLLFITLLATQLGAQLSNASSDGLQPAQLFLDMLMMSESSQLESFGGSIDAAEVMETLLGHVVVRKTFSKDVPAPTPTTSVRGDVTLDIEGGGVTEEPHRESAWSAFIELGRFFAFPFQEFARMLITGDNEIPPPYAPFGDLCLYLILLLVNCRELSPYRAYLSGMRISSSSAPVSARNDASSSISYEQVVPQVTVRKREKVTFSALYSSLVTRISEDSTLLLLYMLLQTNEEFHSFLASRADLDALVLPLLKCLYRAHEQTRARIYTIMIILTILSCDEHFIHTTQAVAIDTPSWFKEKFLRQLPLPEFIALVILRTAQLNLRIIKDDYLQENCMACLGNLASQLTGLCLYSAKRFLQTAQLFIQHYHSLLRKTRTISIAPKASAKEAIEGDSEEEEAEEDQYDFLQPHATTDTLATEAEEHLEEKEDGENPNMTISMAGVASEVVEDGIDQRQLSGRELLQTLDSTENHIRTMLEIVDCLFRRKPSSNIQLIYALILDADLFDSLLSHQRLYGIAQVLKANTEYFLREVQKKECDTPAQVVACITALALQWRSSTTVSGIVTSSSSSLSTFASSSQDPLMSAPTPPPPSNLPPIADLKFCYQETNASDFFTPCIWKLLLKHQAQYFYWNPASIALYETEAGVDPNFSGDDGPDDPPRSNVPENV